MSFSEAKFLQAKSFSEKLDQNSYNFLLKNSSILKSGNFHALIFFLYQYFQEGKTIIKSKNKQKESI